MGGIGVVGMGIGIWLMYEAWRNTAPAPVAKAKATLTSSVTPTPTAGTTFV